MKSKRTNWRGPRDDEGVSPVIAVILMVAITVVLAATVYVWVSGFAAEDTGPENAAATAKGADLGGDGDAEWVQVTLTSGENAPYSFDDVGFSVTANDGTSVDTIHKNATTGATHEFSSGDSWDVGENMWIACQGDGNHLLTVSVSGTTILDTSVSCDAAQS